MRRVDQGVPELHLRATRYFLQPELERARSRGNGRGKERLIHPRRARKFISGIARA